MLKLIQLTDTHVTPPGTNLHGVDMAARLAACVERIALRHPDADAVILTGDLVDDGSVSSYRHLRRTLERLPACPRHYCLGNHDDRTAFRAVFPEAASDANGFIQWTGSIGGVTLIGLDTLIEGTHAGALGHERLAFLRDQLAASTGPVLLFLHHLPFRNGIRRFDKTMLHDATELGAVLAPHRARLRHMFMGHTHRPITGTWQGVPFTVSPGTCLPSLLDLDAPVSERFTAEPTFTVILIDGDDIMVHVEELIDPASLVGRTLEAAASAI